MRSLFLLGLGLAWTLSGPISARSEDLGLRTNIEPQHATAPPQAAARPKSCGELSRNLTTEERNRRCVAMADPLVDYRDGTLTLRMDDGKRKVFKNDGSEAEVSAFGYALLDFYPGPRLFVVTYAGTDSGTTVVVDGRTGRSTDFGGGFPFYAPSGRWILVDDSNDSGGDLSAFSLIDAAGPKPKTIWSSNADPTMLSSRRLRFVRWEDDTHVRFELGRGKSPVLLVRADDGRWHYDLADDTDEPETGPVSGESKPKPEVESTARAKH